MLPELAIRFVLGGLVVSAFAVIGDTLHPKSFGGKRYACGAEDRSSELDRVGRAAKHERET